MQEVIKFPECLGCEKITLQEWEVTGAKVRMCSVYIKPSVWWRRGGCPIKPKEVVKLAKKWVNPLKASKRGMK